MSPELAVPLFFGIMLLFMAAGIPVAFCFGLASILGLYFVGGGLPAVYQVGISAFFGLRSFTLVAVPLYILMAEVLADSEVGKYAYKFLRDAIRPIPGALAVATVLGAGVFAACSGSSAANVAVMGRLSVGEMVEHKYDKRLASGCVAAGGTVGILIPPSLAMLIFCSLTDQSAGRLFFAGVFPGIVSVALFVIDIVILVLLRPGMAPRGEPVPIKQIVSESWGLIPLILVAVVVLGSIYTGIVTATEAAALGLLIAFFYILITRHLTWNGFLRVSIRTARVTAFIGFLIFTATVYSQFMAQANIKVLIQGLLGPAAQNATIMTLLPLIMSIILGLFMDSVGIQVLVIPLAYPFLASLGVNPIWFGILWVITLEVGMVTPPFGINLFISYGMFKEYGVTLKDVVMGSVFFYPCYLVALIIVWFFPALSLWLPNRMFGVG